MAKTPVQKIQLAGQQYVLMPLAEYEKLAGLARSFSASFVSPKPILEPSPNGPLINEGQSKLKAWRTHRGLTQQQLARQAGVKGAYITLLESGKRQGGIKLWSDLAKVLDVNVEAIIPN